MQHIFLTVLEAGKSKITGPADVMSGKGLIFGSLTLPFMISHGRERELSKASFIKAPIPFMSTELS